MLNKITALILISLFIVPNSYALNLSRVKTWSNEVLTASDLNAEFDNILNHSITNSDISASANISGSKLDLTTGSPIGSSSASTGAFTTLSTTGDVTIGDVAGDALHINSNSIDFEGATADAFETSLVITDPTADRTITVPNANSITLPSGAVFFMATGSCPPGTTDVSSSYSNKFIKINATSGTSSGVVLSGTTDSHTITTSELPASALTFTRYDGNGSSLTGVQGTTNGQSAVTQSTSNMGSGGGHTHTISSATTLEPSSITMNLCQVS